MRAPTTPVSAFAPAFVVVRAAAIFVAVSFAWWAPVSLAQEGTVGQATEQTEKLVPPTLVQGAEPTYPADAFAEGVGGGVLLEIDVGVRGQVRRAKVVESPDPRLSWSALGAATRLRFAPATLGKKKVAVRIQYRFEFAAQVIEEERAVDEKEADEALAAATAEEKAKAPVNFRGRVMVAAEALGVGGAAVLVEAVKEGDDGELVVDNERPFSQEVYTADDGTFEMRGVPSGRHRVVIVATSFETFEALEQFSAAKMTEMVAYLRPSQEARFETVVRERRSRRTVTTRVLTTKELTRVPGTFGDPVRVVQRLPGVARAPFGLGAVLVRGGAPDDTAILIDGHLTRTLFHLGAGPSVLNGDLIESLEFYPGGFDARFGRAHAGVIDVKTRDPNRERWSGEVSADVLNAGFRLEGPLLGGALFFAGRRSYIADVLNVGVVIEPFFDTLEGTRLTLAPRYSDYQFKGVWHLGHGHSFVLNVLGADDDLDLIIDASNLSSIVPENVGSAAGFHRINPVWRFRSASQTPDGDARFSAYISPMAEVQASETRLDDSRFGLDSQRVALRAEAVMRPLDFVTFTVGTDNVAARFVNETDLPFLIPTERLLPRPQTSDPPRFKNVDEVNALSLAAYAMAELKLGPVTVLGGLRSDYISYYDQVRVVVDPRLNLRWQVLKSVTALAYVGLFHKAATPVELSDKFGNPNLPLEEGWQYGGGLEVALTRSLDVEWQIFYKDLDNLARFVTSPLAFDSSGEPRVQAVGEKRVLGTEILVRQRLDKGFFGWVAYTLLRAEERNKEGKGGPTRFVVDDFDQTHILSIAASYQLPWDFEIGGAFRYVTGVPQTFAISGITDTDSTNHIRQNEPFRNSRLPPFIQVDLRVDKRFTFDTWALDLYLDLQNATNRENYEFFTYSYDYRFVAGFPGLPIIPSFGFKASF